MVHDRILFSRDAARSRSFSESIALEDGAAEAHFEEFQHFILDRGRSGDHLLYASSKRGFHLLENQAVIASRSISSI